jgi:chromate transporter
MDWISFFLSLLKSILFSSGGYGPLPSLHSDFIANGWASQKQFSDSLTIGQITPGPSGFWIISFCFLVAGWRGAALSCAALLLPPLLILLIQRGYRYVAGFSATQGVLDGVVLVISTFSVIVVLQIFIGNGIDVLTVAVAVVSAALALSRKVSTNLILLAALVIGFFVH